jgi:hypothetical protein
MADAVGSKQEKRRAAGVRSGSGVTEPCGLCKHLLCLPAEF